MNNVGNGNLIVQSDDVSIPERGVDLAFRRTFNSLSQHDYAGTDGATPSNYGNGWTNPVDAHLSYNPVDGKISVYDIDGAQYVYSPNNGQWVAPPGQHATLTFDGSCGYYWTKKTGTEYHFWSPTYSSCDGAQYAGYNGRLYQIFSRNHNNSIQFNYSWTNGDASSSVNLSQIVAQHSDGQSLTLAFADFGSHRLLYTITRPDGQIIRYAYDANASLTDVCVPGNGTTDNSPSAAAVCGDTTHIHHRYGWNANTYQMLWADSPMWTMYWGGPAANGSGGAYVNFAFQGSQPGQLQTVQYLGYANFIPADGANALLQPNDPNSTDNATVFRTATFTYGTLQTSYADTDGHNTTWTYDASQRVTQTQGATGESSPTYLITTQQWDSNDNLTETTDPRGNATDYAYDNNGNAIAVAEPSVTTSQGTFRPTSLYSYDSANNVVAYCDPIETNALGKNWTTNPGTRDSLCPSASGATRYIWNVSDSAEPFGYLTDAYTPMGYHTTFTYNTSQEDGVDAGLPTTVQAATAITQTDGTSRTPIQTFTYDAYGNVSAYSKGIGNWSLSYDSLNRLTTASDPTSVTSYKYYNADGSLSKTETAYQHATATGSTYLYDADANEIQEAVSHGGTYSTGGAPSLATPAPTTKVYDGIDRLVEVEQPQDSADVYTKPWITRYIYDLSQNGSASRPTFQGQTLVSYGNLAKTQEFLPSGNTLTTRVSSMAPTQFDDIKGQSFDALDRLVTSMQLTNTGGSTDTLNKNTLGYDGSGYYGLLTTSCNALAVCATKSYDARNQLTQESYSDSTSTKTVTYDPDGRSASVGNTYATYSYAYDGDGRQIQSKEPFGAGGASLTAPTTLTRHYYTDGKLSSLDASSTAFTQAALFSYAYRVDGPISWEQINDASVGGVVNSGVLALAMQYDNAGRIKSRAESGAGANTSTTTLTYDSYGNATSKAFPGGTLGTIEYDATGAPLGYQPTWPNQTTFPTVAYGYTSRGELRGDNSGDIYSTFANGVALSQQYPSKTPQLYQTIDPAMAVVTAHSNVPPGTDPGTVATYSSVTESYDDAGRMIQTGTEEDTNYATCQTLTSANRQYDALNRTTSETYSYDNTSCSGPFTHGSASYDWAANDHPIGIGSGFETTGSSPPPISGWDTLHWDGDELLFTTNGSGHVDDIKIGTFGDLIPSVGPVFYDRGFGTNISYCHTSGAVYGVGAAYHNLAYTTEPCALGPGMLWEGSPPAPLTKQDSGGVKNGVGNGGLLASVNGDGWGDDYNTVQGIRTVDSLTSTWTTPDAYAGEVHDPMSQKSYMWDHNNALEYQDPTGYCVEDACVAEGSAAALTWLALGGVALVAAATHHDDVAKAASSAQSAITNAVKSAASVVSNAFRGGALPATGPAGGAIRRGDSVQYYDKNGFRTKRVDLGGKTHGGVETPHTHDYGPPNVSPDGTVHPGDETGVRPSTSQEVQDASNKPHGASGGGQPN